MEPLLTRLLELDSLYASDSLSEYEKLWKVVEQQIRDTHPGFTLAYAEVYLTGQQREAHGGMRHVLVPQQALESAESQK